MENNPFLSLFSYSIKQKTRKKGVIESSVHAYSNSSQFLLDIMRKRVD